MYNQTKEIPNGYNVIVAIDWADRKHDLRIRCGYEEKTLTLTNNLPKLNEFFLDLLAENRWQKIAVVIETTQSALMHLLNSISQFDLFAVHPTTASSYAKTFSPSGAKNDTSDTASLMDLFIKHPEKIRKYNVEKDSSILDFYNEKRRYAVDDRTKFGNQLTALLKKYYPIALQVNGNHIYSPISMGFLEKWSSPQKLLLANKQQLSRFFNTRTSKKCTTPIKLEILQSAMVVVEDEHVTEMYETELFDLLRRIKALNESIKIYESKITRCYQESDDYEVFNSLPGSGKVLGPRVMAFFSQNRERFSDVQEALTYSEIAPVLQESGRMSITRRRYRCDKFRQQTFVEFADGSRKKSLWAQEFYIQKKAQGKSHYTILRALAYKWIRIIYKCWLDKVPYDESKYLKALKNFGSPLVNNSTKTSTI
jgi:hypothetical protein